MRSLVLLKESPAFPEDKKILGRTLADRQIIPAARAGFQTPPDFSGPVLILPSSLLLSSQLWKKLAALPLEPETMITGEDLPFCYVHTNNSALLNRALSKGSAASALKELSLQIKNETIPLSSQDWIPCRDEKDLPAVEGWLLQGLVKDTEGFMSKHFERKISLSLTRHAVITPMTPNEMTIFSALIGVVGACFFLSPSRWMNFVGALLFWLSSVLDGCDGEMARLKFIESRFGGVLDFWADNVVHSAVFFCIACGYFRNAPIAPVLGALAVAGTLCSAGLVYWTTMRGKKQSEPVFTHVVADSGPPSKFERFIDFLARRDFIYLVIILSIFGKIHWFLWMGAAGSPIYFMILLILNRGHHT